MNRLIFDEENLYNGNIYKYESRLHSHVNKYIEGGATLTTFWNVNENTTTTDRGLRDIEALFGRNSPLRFDKIDNFPIYGIPQLSPTNTDEPIMEDIMLEGEGIILPSTIVPKLNSIFRINHLKMKAFFQIIEVIYDSMKVDGFYKIRFRLFTSTIESEQNLEEQTVAKYKCDLNAIGSNINPIIRTDDFIKREKINKMINGMINSYRSLFYNDRHNCFIYRDVESNMRWFDVCCNEFMAHNSIMNIPNTSSIIMLHHKLNDPQMPLYYNSSVYSWIEKEAPIRFMQKFKFHLVGGENYFDSSFNRWSESDIMVMIPDLHNDYKNTLSIFNNKQLELFSDINLESDNEYETLIQKYINGTLTSIEDISLYIADSLMSNIKSFDIYVYTPIVIYIMRKVLEMN